MQKHPRGPKQTPRMLKVGWGKLKGCKPDIIFNWGKEIPASDAHLIHGVLCGERYDINNKVWDASLVKELESRGYDITTLKFSIKLKDNNQ